MFCYGEMKMISQRHKIFIIEEDVSYRELLVAALRGNYTVTELFNYDGVVPIVEQARPDLVIIDVDAADNRGIALCEALKSNRLTKSIPVMLITSFTNVENFVLGLQVGASDYIIKPFCIPSVVARIESHLRSQEDYSILEHKDLLMLLQLSETISVTRSPKAILRLIVDKMSNIFDVARCSVISFADGVNLVVKASSDLEENRELKIDIERYPEIRQAIETRKTVVVNDIKNDPLMQPVRDYIEKLDFNSIIVIPLIKKEGVIGTFFLRTASKEKGWVSERICKLSQLVASIAANALENATLFESIKAAQEYFEKMSIQDDLTKIYNRRHFFARLQEEFSRSARHHEPLSLLFFDVDGFKLINDRFGHTTGDVVLTKVGSILREVARKSDLPARYGGDEFSMILPNTDSVGAKALGERIIALVGGYRFEELGGESISISMGISCHVDGEIDSFKRLLQLADEAMYRAKGRGGGQICQATV